MEETSTEVRVFANGHGGEKLWYPSDRLDWHGDENGHPAYARCHSKCAKCKAFHTDIAWENFTADIKGLAFFPPPKARKAPTERSLSPVKKAKAPAPSHALESLAESLEDAELLGGGSAVQFEALGVHVALSPAPVAGSKKRMHNATTTTLPSRPKRNATTATSLSRPKRTNTERNMYGSQI